MKEKERLIKTMILVIENQYLTNEYPKYNGKSFEDYLLEKLAEVLVNLDETSLKDYLKLKK